MGKVARFLNYTSLTLANQMAGGLRVVCSRRAWWMVLLVLYASCEGIDCTVNNVVTCNYAFYSSSSGSKVAIGDTLTITAEGTDSVLYNRGIGVSSLSLPMSYWQEADTLIFLLQSSSSDDAQEFVLRIKKTNTEHFENPDCPTTMFHILTEVDFDSPTRCVDSVVIANKSVSYDSQENIKIYLHADD